MGRVVVVRHGQASIHKADYDQLSELGHAQSTTLGAWWAERGERFDAVFVGPAKRHRQTHAEVAASLELPPAQPLEGLAEHDAFGLVRAALPLLADDPAMKPLQAALTGATTPAERSAAFQRIFELAMTQWLDGRLAPEGIEPWPAFRDRVLAAFESLEAASQGGRRVVAFSSVGPVAVMLGRALGCPDLRAFETGWRLRNAAITEFRTGRGLATLDRFNAVPHLADASTHTYR
ncbi:MAG: histidine phosphatase family protein [Myxococcota bacterium]